MAYKDPADQKRAAQAHYQAHKEDYKARAKVARRKNRVDNQPRLLEYLREHPCVDCGEKDPIVLHFDHIGADKLDDVSRMLHTGDFWKKILREIAKCEVVCANCHMRRTARRHGGWFKMQAQVMK